MRKIIEMILALLVLGIGIYMAWHYEYPTPPALSGIAFILIGLHMWLPNCPIMAKFCPLKK